MRDALERARARAVAAAFAVVAAEVRVDVVGRLTRSPAAGTGVAEARLPRRAIAARAARASCDARGACRAAAQVGGIAIGVGTATARRAGRGARGRDASAC